MLTAEEKLCSRSWRLRNSAWMLPTIFAIGLLNWACYLYIGLKSRTRQWLVWAALWGLWAVVVGTAVSLTGDDAKETSTTAESVAGGIAAVGGMAGIVQAFIINRRWLIWRANNQPTSWYHRTSTEDRKAPSSEEIDRLLRQGSGSLSGPPAEAEHGPSEEAAMTSRQPIDLNTASAEVLERELGLSTEHAAAAVAGRERLGGFDSTDQLITEAGIPPHLYARFRDQVVVERTAGPSPKASGRRLDL